MKVISLGMGVQSTALYYMSSIGELPRADVAIFADTGGEKQATLDYYEVLLEWQHKHNGIPLHKADYRNLKEDILTKYPKGERVASIPAFTKAKDGSKGMVRRQCTSEYKIWQVDRKIKDILNLTKTSRYPKIDIWNGITMDEIQRMVKPPQKWKTMVYPFCGYSIDSNGKATKIDGLQMRRGDVVEWFKSHDLPLPEKSSCVFCPFMSDAHWLRVKRTDPQGFEEAIVVDEAIRNHPKLNSEQYLHRSLIPLKDVQFDEAQTEMFGDCYGFCHI